MGVLQTTGIKLSVASDIDALYDAGYKSMDVANDLFKKAVANYNDASAKFKGAQAKADEAIGMAKNLGVDTKTFDMKKVNAKNAQAKAEKNASVSVLMSAVEMSSEVSAYVELPVGVHIIADKKYTVVEVIENQGQDNEWKRNVIELIEPATPAQA